MMSSSEKTNRLSVMIGRMIVDEAMKILVHQINEPCCAITVCRSTMRKALYSIKLSIEGRKPFGFVRFVFLLNQEEMIVLVNADHVLKNSFTTN